MNKLRKQFYAEHVTSIHNKIITISGYTGVYIKWLEKKLAEKEKKT